MSKFTQEQLDKHRQLLDEHDKKLDIALANAKTPEEETAVIHFNAITMPCCHNEDRDMNGWCQTCGDPCF